MNRVYYWYDKQVLGVMDSAMVPHEGAALSIAFHYYVVKEVTYGVNFDGNLTVANVLLED